MRHLRWSRTSPSPNVRWFLQDRRRGAGHALYNSLAIERKNYEVRSHQLIENFRFIVARTSPSSLPTANLSPMARWMPAATSRPFFL